MTRKIDLSSPLGRIAVAVVGTLLALLTFVVVVGAMVVGLVVAAVVVLWSLLRGRRPPPVNLRWGADAFRRRTARPASGDVVDIEVREVDAAPPR